MRRCFCNTVLASLVALLASVNAVHADHLVAGLATGGEIKLQVSPSEVDTTRATVTFSIPVNAVGSGVAQAMTNAAPIFIEAAVRMPTPAPGLTRNLNISVINGNTALSSASTTVTIPFSNFSWTSAVPAASSCSVTGGYGTTADFPATGAFTGASPQAIIASTFNGAKFCINGLLTFLYANTSSIPAGTYTGTLTFQASLP